MDVLKKIGKGSYGTVYTCTSKLVTGSNDFAFALKIMPFEFHEKFFEENMVSILREVWATSSRHCGIRRLAIVQFVVGSLKRHNLKTCDDNIREDAVMGIGLAMPLADFTLQALMNRSIDLGQRLPRKIVATIVSQIVHKLSNLHDRLQCMHRDLKPGNIVVSIRNGSLVVDIIDYGMLTFRSKSRDPGVTTSPFRAPEIFLRSPYTNKVDVWSLGIIVFELLTGIPFCDWKSNDAYGDSMILQGIFKRLGRPSVGDIDTFDTIEGLRVLGNVSRPPRVDLHVVLTHSHDHICADGCPPLNTDTQCPDTQCPLIEKKLDDLDRFVLSALQLDPERRPTITELAHSDMIVSNFANYETSFDKIQAMDYIVKLSSLASSSSSSMNVPSASSSPTSPTLSTVKHVDSSDFIVYSVTKTTINNVDDGHVNKKSKGTDYSSNSDLLKFDFVYNDISTYYGALRDEKNARFAIVDGIMKIKSLHSFPDSFVWNCFMIADALLCPILIEYAVQCVSFSQKEADVFACALCFVCAAPFEERPYVLEQDFLRAFLKRKEDRECVHCSGAASISEASIITNPGPSSACTKMFVSFEEPTMPSLIAVMSAVIDILKRSDFTLITFAEYRGKSCAEVNSYSSDKCKQMIDRFCASSGKNAWINSFGLCV